jgi:hypothetical protein
MHPSTYSTRMTIPNEKEKLKADQEAKRYTPGGVNADCTVFQILKAMLRHSRLAPRRHRDPPVIVSDCDCI